MEETARLTSQPPAAPGGAASGGLTSPAGLNLWAKEASLELLILNCLCHPSAPPHLAQRRAVSDIMDPKLFSVFLTDEVPEHLTFREQNVSGAVQKMTHSKETTRPPPNPLRSNGRWPLPLLLCLQTVALMFPGDWGMGGGPKCGFSPVTAQL